MKKDVAHFQLRLPREIHRKLIHCARIRGISLNAFITEQINKGISETYDRGMLDEALSRIQEQVRRALEEKSGDA